MGSRTPRHAADRVSVRGLELAWGARTYLMGIINATPDSFSGDGTGSDLELSVARADWLVKAGADIVDIGGESTRPGSTPLDAATEISRVLPVVEAVRARSDAPISIDTYKAEVAEAALDAGADIVNDVWGLRADPGLAEVVARRGVPVVLMHNRSDPNRISLDPALGGRYLGMESGDIVADVTDELSQSVDIAHRAGVADEHILIDPGLGFGKTYEQNLELINRLGEIRMMGYPVLVGPSRKSFIGLTLDSAPADRVEGTAASVALAIDRGADIIRVHDVTVMSRVACMTDAIVRPGRNTRNGRTGD